ncbi:dihydrofolate reductase [Bacillus lacus]|uniref:Dihydrofolate reductase n=1 Tax=Metabacillus lacus TaxID=1983721 RepID=A0A7X2IXG2_9BACI|nr:dihydrofolate reductase [Metabacillus lacus]MRX70903.1 dihydrofolate reductase [Metabacillus lacus]
MISLLFAMDQNRLIGKNNDLPWRLPADLAYFKKVTMGHKIIMGRKTFDSIGKPLPGRENFILTRDTSYHQDGCSILHSTEELLQLNKECGAEELFVIGGTEIFKEVLPHSSKMYVTRIEESFEGDKYFPFFEEKEWTVLSKEKGVKNEKNPYDYEFLVYQRK